MISQAAIARSQSGQRKSHGLAVDQRARARRIYSAMRQLRQSLRTRSRELCFRFTSFRSLHPVLGNERASP